MGKRIVKWTLDGTILKLSKHLEDPKAVAEIEAEFNLDELILALDSNEDFRLQAVAYLAKQRMMDTGANDIGDADGKVAAAKKRWNDLTDGKWTAERVNATGKAANKKLVDEVKNVSKTVTLQGLIAKKFIMKETLTAEEEAKLVEFMKIASTEAATA